MNENITTVSSENGENISHPWIKNSYGCELQVKIDPHLAKYLLDNFNKVNEGIREMSQKHIGTISDALRNGQWISQSGLNIAFSDEGLILDGQGRLQACVDTGISIVSDVFFGMKRVVASVRDGNRPRSASTMILMGDGESHTQEEKKRLDAQFAIAKIWLWQANGFKHFFKGSHFSLMNFVKEKEESINSALIPGEVVKARSAGFRTACAQYIEKYPVEGKEFLNQVTGNGAGLTDGAATLCLRNYLLNRKGFSGGQAGQKTDYQHTAYAIYCFHNNISIKKLGQVSKKEVSVNV